MTNFLIRIFIKQPDNTDSQKTRAAYGTLSSFVGIFCNIILFIAKYIVGTLSNSISIISDAFNNLSDSASCIITLFGYKISSKPADKDHPFGHGRMEYLTSLIISAIIVFVGLELFKGSLQKLLNPEEVKFSIAALVSLIISIGIKLWLSLFNTTLGKKINSVVMLATAKDSRNDVITTISALIALVFSIFSDLPLDALMGIFVSLFILKSGYEIIKDTVDELLGKPASPETTSKLYSMILKNEKIIGVHDMIVHSYGPSCTIASCHVEVKATENFVAVHELVDKIERDVLNEMNILLTIHMDPIDTDDENVQECKNMILEIIGNIDNALHIHDFRIVSGEMHTNLIFDLVVPYKTKYSSDEIKAMIDDRLSKFDHRYFTVITFDTEYI
ncbi:MAG: cation transporter [Ruminococcus sp.]|nr:cation transporter [Ruminococcus sp.]MBQ7009252.1 cation transporter [Ruminococcus sp.]